MVSSITVIRSARSNGVTKVRLTASKTSRVISSASFFIALDFLTMFRHFLAAIEQRAQRMRTRHNSDGVPLEERAMIEFW
jgi:hypothetical protein